MIPARLDGIGLHGAAEDGAGVRIGLEREHLGDHGVIAMPKVAMSSIPSW